MQRVSKNYQRASSEYRAYLESLRSDERIFWSLCRSVSPVRSSWKERQRSGKSTLKSRSTDDRVAYTRSTSSSGNGDSKTNSRVEKKPSRRGRSGRVQDSKERSTCSLPPALEQDHHGVDSSGSFTAIRDTENCIEVDLYLTSVTLQSCIESYSRRLYNICRMVDLDSEQEDFFEETYFEETNYGIPSKDIRDSETERTREQTEGSTGSVKAKDKTFKSRPNAQPQVSNETISETASKWSVRLRSDFSPSGSSGLDAGNDSKSHSTANLSRATRSRLLLKEKISKMSILSETDPERAGSAGCNRVTDTSPTSGTGNNHPVVNVILKQNSNISKQPFSSLFNI